MMAWREDPVVYNMDAALAYVERTSPTSMIDEFMDEMDQRLKGDYYRKGE